MIAPSTRFSTLCRFAIFLALVVSIVFVATGCSYTQKELYPADYRSVSVPIMRNLTFYRGVEFDVTEALIKEIELRTPYKVIAQGSADTELVGTIRSINQTQVSQRSTGAVPQEMEMSVLIDWQWKDLRSGKPIRDRQGFQAVARYVPTRPVSEDITTGRHGVAQAAATAIVSQMRADW